MSSPGSPAHGFQGNYEPRFYDADFTAEISNKMRVPERIQAAENGFSDPAIVAAFPRRSEQQPPWMHVPERIVVAGGDRHIEGREPLPEQRFESSIHGNVIQDPPIQLEAPPQVITLNQHTFPTVDESLTKAKKKLNIELNGKSSADDNFNENGDTFERDVQLSPPSAYTTFMASNTSMGGTPGDEITHLRKQIRILTRRINAIEVDNQHRHQREVVIYSLSAIYLVVKGLLWLHRNW